MSRTVALAMTALATVAAPLPASAYETLRGRIPPWAQVDLPVRPIPVAVPAGLAFGRVGPRLRCRVSSRDRYDFDGNVVGHRAFTSCD